MPVLKCKSISPALRFGSVLHSAVLGVSLACARSDEINAVSVGVIRRRHKWGMTVCHRLSWRRSWVLAR